VKRWLEEIGERPAVKKAQRSRRPSGQEGNGDGSGVPRGPGFHQPRGAGPPLKTGSGPAGAAGSRRMGTGRLKLSLRFSEIGSGRRVIHDRRVGRYLSPHQAAVDRDHGSGHII
jgi:hypothetical protein